MKQITIILAVLALAGCASVQSSNPRSVTIKAGAAMGGKAQQLADAECAKHGRYARPTGAGNTIMEFTFDCVN